MLVPKTSDIIHKAWLYRVLSGVADNTFLVSLLRFKGGTCAAMRGIIDRFSVDLDFDMLTAKTGQIEKINTHLETIFNDLGLEIKDRSKRVPQFFLRYKNAPGERSILRFDVTSSATSTNEYEPYRFIEIDRIIYCQTIPTMFSNKLVAAIERYEKYKSIAGRDIFDIHTFFSRGYTYLPQIIMERRNMKIKKFFEQLYGFIQKKVTQNILDEDLNHLMEKTNFHRIRKFLKQEVLMFIMAEIKRL